MAKTARLTMFATRLGGEMNARRALLGSLGQWPNRQLVRKFQRTSFGFTHECHTEI